MVTRHDEVLTRNDSLIANESPVSAVSCAAILAGSGVAAAVSLLLVALGAGLGFASLSPWSAEGPSATTFTVMTAIWLILVQWIASGMGGYLTGRLRTKWAGTHTHEVFFRDTAHGFITWAEVADAARKSASAASIFTALSMLIGAFIASVAAALGGRERDQHP